MLPAFLFGVAMLIGDGIETEWGRSGGGSVIQIGFDEASQWYLNVVFAEAVGAIVLAFLFLYWVFRKYGNSFTYD